ncbi:hypothetical protein I6F11_29755 [Ensifer sp. NBAIM29]|nr:hypothetical protein [Ensifer sp. NBAIM29]
MAILIGEDRAEKIADDLIRTIRAHIAYIEADPHFPKQIKTEAVIFSLTPHSKTTQHGYGSVEDRSGVPRTPSLGGFGLQAHESSSEYDAARACDGDAA